LADKTHPYISGAGGISAAISHFRKSFPANVNSETLKKLGIASNNESYLINILRFIGAIDDDGNKTPKAAAVFSKHTDADFHKGFEEMVKTAYGDLFGLHGDAAWELDTEGLITYFRNTDETSDLVGKRQAATFQALATFAGHGDAPTPARPRLREAKPKPAMVKTEKAAAFQVTAAPAIRTENRPNDVALTVRIEVNLPPAADQETYDRIFRSIRENLLNADAE
jgi:uncharacterized protein DUF5343